MIIMQVITRSELGGAQSVLANLSNELCKQNKIIVIAGEGDGKLWEILDKRIIQIPCPYIKRKPSIVNDTRAVCFLKRAYRDFKPDVIHLHSSKAGLLGRMAFPSSKIVYTVHGFDSIRLRYRSFIPVERIFQNFCSAIVGVSAYDESCLKQEKICKHVSFIYNGIPSPNLKGNRKLSVPQKFQKKVLCIARISKQKRFDLFIEVAKLLPQYAFVWIGNIQEINNVPNNVFMMGNIVNAQAFCSDADVFFLPSNYEGLPIVIIEAMSHSKPIVASNVGGISEIVENEVNGYTTRNDSKEMADALSSILVDKEKEKAMGSKSLQIYESKLTLEKMVSQYQKLYIKITERV
jgi:glycosyltransferase involved in cell wall biosynthesis